VVLLCHMFVAHYILANSRSSYWSKAGLFLPHLAACCISNPARPADLYSILLRNLRSSCRLSISSCKPPHTFAFEINLENGRSSHRPRCDSLGHISHRCCCTSQPFHDEKRTWILIKCLTHGFSYLFAYSGAYFHSAWATMRKTPLAFRRVTY